MTSPLRVPDVLPSDPALVTWLELAESQAIELLMAAVGELPGNPFGAMTTRVADGSVVALDAVPFGLFNRCMGLGASRPATEADVDAVARVFVDRGTPESLFQLAPAAVTPDVRAWLEARGYQSGRNWVKLWHDLEDLEPARPVGRIERVDTASIDDFGRVICAAFELPSAFSPVATAGVGASGTTMYLGYDGDAPVAAGALTVIGDVAWLGWGATVSEHRGRGWQTAILRQRLLDARAAGCRMAVTETGEETDDDPVNHSYRNMLRTGFRLAYARRNWVRRA